jgi:hypothetical protein
VHREIRTRERLLKDVDELESNGSLSPSDAERAREKYRGHIAAVREAAKRAPVLDQLGLDIWNAWREFGDPYTMLGGLSPGIVDERGNRYMPRRAWLDENGITEFDQRSFFFECWKVLDAEIIQHVTDQMTESIKKSSGKVHRRSRR